MRSVSNEDARFNVIMDRAFDVVCARRAGLPALADEILDKLKKAHPERLFHIDQAISIYNGVKKDLTDARGAWLVEHKDKLKLKYK